MLDILPSVLDFARSASPTAVIALLAVIIWQLISAKKDMHKIQGNDLHHIAQDLQSIEKAVRDLHEPLGRIEREIAVVKTIVTRKSP